MGYIFKQRKFYKSKIFQHALWSYIVLIFIFIAVILGVFSWLHGAMQNEMTKNANETVIKYRDVIDRELIGVMDATNIIASDDSMISFISRKYSSEQDMFEGARTLSKSFPKYHIVNDNIERMLVYYMAKEIIIEPDHATSRVESYYDTYLNFEGISFIDWNSEIKKSGSKSHFHKLIDPKTNRITSIAYIRYLPLQSLSPAKGCVVAVMDMKQLLSQIGVSSFLNGAVLEVLDDSGNLIEKTHDDLVGEKDKNNIFLEKSDVVDWQYRLIVPQSQLMMQAKSITRTFIVLLSVIIAILMTVGVINAYSTTEPAREIANLLEFDDNNSNSSNYLDIKDGVLSLLDRNKKLRTEVNKQFDRLRERLLTTLLFEEFASEDEAKSYLDSLSETNRISAYYRVALASIPKEIDNYIRIETLKNIIEQVFYGIDGIKVYAQGMGKEKIGIFIGYDSHDLLNEIKGLFNVIVKQLREKFNEDVLFVIGKEQTNLLYLQMSYMDALQEIQDVGYITGKVIINENNRHDEKVLYFPIELESKLMSLVRMGEGIEASSVLKEIDIKNNAISSQLAKIFFMEKRAMLMKLVFNLVKNQDVREKMLIEIDNIFQMKSIEIVNMKIIEMVKSISDYVVSIRQSQNSTLKDKIVIFIEEEYSNDAMSLALIADKFDLSQKYVSNFFKEQIGENFISYLEKRRMIEVIKLMKTTRKNLRDIAKEVGYTNQNTFYKAFKRKHGMSPGEYRQRL